MEIGIAPMKKRQNNQRQRRSKGERMSGSNGQTG